MWIICEVRENDGTLAITGAPYSVDFLDLGEWSRVISHGITSNTLWAAWARTRPMNPAEMADCIDMFSPDRVLAYLQGRLFTLRDDYVIDVGILGA